MVTETPASDLSSFLGDNPDFTRVYDNVQAVVPMVQLPLVKMLLWNTIEDFCVRSSAFRVKINWSMGISVSQIDFNPVDGDTLVAWVHSVTGLPSFRVDPPGLLVDLLEPLAVRTGTATVATKPVSFDATMPPLLFTNWFDVILSGVFMRLHEQAGRPWSSQSTSALHGRRYRSGLNSAHAQANALFGNAPQWQFPYYANGR